jgi:hypothetical protein
MPTDDNNWSLNWDVTVNKPVPPPTKEDDDIVIEAKNRFRICVAWEAQARVNFEYDYKFANADTHNHFQWDDVLYNDRTGVNRPCLTINKTNQHNLMVINDAKQNKPGVRIRPVGDEASYDAAQLFQEIVYHIEYISNAESIYDSALTFQVEAGIGYWRIQVEYPDDESFDQEIYIRRIKDPRSVYLDPNINEVDGSDAWFGFIFDDEPKDLFKSKYPEYASIVSNSVLGGNSPDGWMTQNTVRVCEYYRKTQKKSKLVTWINANGGQVLKKIDDLDEQEKLEYKEIHTNKENREAYQYQERKLLIDDVQWFKIAGDRIIDRGPWLGKYVPIVRLVGTETVINGVLDRKGHTRQLIDPQRMYNWNASADVEYGALQTKVPWLAPAAAIEGFEEYYKTANTVNHSYLPYNHIDENGDPIPPPTRPAAPQASPAYVQRMQISIQEMMMTTGQYQSQTGENENAKSGVAINARQRQGDRATYHFLDNQAMAIRNTGKQIIDLIPKIYDTKRVQRITASDGTIINMTIDPNAPDAVKEMPTNETDNDEKIKELIFNPNIGTYDIQADTGPSYATKRMESFSAMSQLAASSKEFMERAGDIYFEMADFPKSQALSKRWKKFLPPNIANDGPDPQVEQAMHQAADKIEQLTGLVTEQAQQLKDKNAELELKAKDLERKEHELELNFRKAKVGETRDDWDAISRRIAAVGNAGPAFSLEQVQPLIKQAVAEALGMPDIDEAGIGDGGTPIEPVAAGGEGEGADEPPVPGARKAPDGAWYVEQNNQHYRVE